MTTSVVRAKMLTSGPTCFLLIGCLSSNSYQLASANELGREGLDRDNTITYSGRRQVISGILQGSNRDMQAESQSQITLFLNRLRVLVGAYVIYQMKIINICRLRKLAAFAILTAII